MHVNPFVLIATVVLIIVFVVMQRRKMAAQQPKKPVKAAPSAVRPPKPVKPPEEVYANMRRQALATLPEAVGMAGQFGESEAFGSLMETGLPDSVVTLACFANGDASFYFNTGGGMIGGGVHEPVRKAAKEFVALAQGALPAMSPATDQPPPEPGKVRFYVLTPRGTFTTEIERESLAEPGCTLSPLFYSGQEVVAKMRQVQEQRSA
jgi:hypothetical protein